jgi:hypothetical protein
LARRRGGRHALRRWHRLGIILTIIGGIGLFYAVFMRDGELGEDIYFRQTNECRVAERRGLPGAPNRRSEANRDGDGKRRSSERIEPKI